MALLISLAFFFIGYRICIVWERQRLKDIAKNRSQYPKAFKVPKVVDMQLDEIEDAISR